MRSGLRMRRPIDDLLGLHWQGLGRGVLRQRHQAQATRLQVQVRVRMQVSPGRGAQGPRHWGGGKQTGAV